MSKNFTTIEVKPRLAKKSANTAGRKEELVPAVVYGPKQESTSVFIPNKFFVLSKAREGNTIYTLEGDVLSGSKVMIKKVLKNPIGNKILHVDLYAPDMTKSVRVEVDLDFQGEPVGVKEGGVLQTIRRSIELECPVIDIPKSITVDISEMKIGDTLKIDDVAVSEKYKVMSAPEYAVITVAEATKEEETPAAAEGEAAPAAEATPASE